MHGEQPEVGGHEPIKVLYPYNGALDESTRNMNCYQRARFIGDQEELHLVVPRGSRVAESLLSRVRLHRSPLPGSPGFALYALCWIVRARLRRFDVILTGRSYLALLGWIGTRRSRTTWVADITSPLDSALHRDCAGLRCWLRRLASQSKRMALRRLLRQANLVFLSVVPDAMAAYQLPPERVRAFSNAIDLESMSADDHRGTDEKLRLCFANRLFLRERGLAVLVEAVELLDDEGIPLEVHLVGEVPGSELETVRSSSSARRFHAHGVVALSTVRNVMLSAEVGVIPHQDNFDLTHRFPLKTYEYMATGCVVVASALKGIRTVIEDGRNGLLVPPEQPTALAAALRRVATEPGLKDALREQALQDVRQYDWSRKGHAVVDELRRLVDSAASTGGAPGGNSPPRPAER